MSSALSIQGTVAPSESTALTSATASVSSRPTKEEEAAKARDTVATDLKNWQEKFAKAADKGTDDLEERVQEITERQMKSQVHGVGEALIVQLEEAIVVENASLKKAIKKIVASLSDETLDAELKRADDDLLKAVRSAGMGIRTKAQSLRSWKEGYDTETYSLVVAASESTLDVLDSIRDLGLQEIGMRWAWMEGITYKDWAKYHALKKTFAEWRQEVASVATQHDGLKKARLEGEELESRGMTVAENAARELTRLKEVGKWKIQAKDTSDDFSTKVMPAKAAVAGQKVMDQVGSISDSVVGTSQGGVESVISQGAHGASNVIDHAASHLSEAVSGSSTPAHESIASDATRKANAALSSASEAVIGSSTPFAESVVSAASRKADQAASGASGAVIGSPVPKHESVTSQALESVKSGISAVSEALSISSTVGSEEVANGASSASSVASSAASKTSNKVFSGAMAQAVKEQKPILDDIISDDEDATYSEKMQSVINQAGDKYADITKAVSEALLKPTSTQGSVESITSVASEQYSSALAAASSALYGTEQGTGESISSVASNKYAQAVAA